jgi:methylated-DNA-[protein]-cysteine S-methyltransferase
LAIAAS